MLKCVFFLFIDDDFLTLVTNDNFLNNLFIRFFSCRIYQVIIKPFIKAINLDQIDIVFLPFGAF